MKRRGPCAIRVSAAASCASSKPRSYRLTASLSTTHYAVHQIVYNIPKFKIWNRNMLAIQSSSQEQKCIPNLLPARLHHDGPINDAQRYWTPEKDAEGKRLFLEIKSLSLNCMYLIRYMYREITGLLPRSPPPWHFVSSAGELHGRYTACYR
jgi:hypothetical protein